MPLPRLLRLTVVLPLALACHGAADSTADPPQDAATDAAPVVGVDAPPDGNHLGAAKACDPFQPGDPPLTRTSGTLAIGRHRDGTVYVIDKPFNDERVFSSEGTGRVFFRRILASEGQGPDTYLFGTAGPGQPFLLKLAFGSNPRLRMGVLRGRAEARDFDLATEGDELEVLDYSTAPLAGKEFRNLPAAAVVVYFAQLEDGRRLAVLRPENETGGQSFRLFLSAGLALVERTIESVVTTEGNRAWVIGFSLDGGHAEATFPTMTGPGSLKADGRTLPLSPLAADAAPRGQGYGCL